MIPSLLDIDSPPFLSKSRRPHICIELFEVKLFIPRPTKDLILDEINGEQALALSIKRLENSLRVISGLKFDNNEQQLVVDCVAQRVKVLSFFAERKFCRPCRQGIRRNSYKRLKYDCDPQKISLPDPSPSKMPCDHGA